MLKWAFRILVIGFLTLAIGGLAALLGHSQWLLALALGISAYFLGGFALKTFASRAFLVPFKLKGQVLQGAELRVHGIEPAAAPPQDSYEDDDEDDDEEPATPRAYYRLDVTITPTAPPGKMSHWEPAELLIVPFDSTDNEVDLEGADATGYVEEVEIYDGSRFVEDDPGKYEGPQRLRLLAAVEPGLRQAKFRYYFESFGRFDLP